MSVAGWVDDYGGTGSSSGNHAVAVDSAGDVYTLGRFTGTAGPNGGQTPTMTSAGAHDLFVAKYLPDGTFVWARRMGGPNDEQTGGIAVDGSGNVYATGEFQGTADFGSTTLTSKGSGDFFVTKLDAAGNFLWAEQMWGTGGIHVYGNLAFDSGGNLYLAGDFSYTASFGGINLTATVGKNNPGVSNAFVAKVDGTGHVVWAQQMGGESLSATGGVATDGVGGVYVAGDIFTSSRGGTATFGAFRLKAPALTIQVFVTKLNENGQFLWAKDTNGSGSSSDGYGIAANARNVYVTGDLGGTTSFDTHTLTDPTGSGSGFVTRVDPTTGAFSWARSLGGYAHTVAEDAQGNVSVGGSFSSTVSFGGQVLTSAGGTDGYVARLDGSGNFLGTWQFGGTGTDDEVAGVAVDSAGVVYAAGWYQNTVSFNTGDRTVPLTSAGTYDSFILKRDPQSVMTASPRSATHLQLQPASVAVSPLTAALTDQALYGSGSFWPTDLAVDSIAQELAGHKARRSRSGLAL